jgi:FAD/FMN-containing dehydrogenase
VVVYVALRFVDQSRTGRAWRSLREDPLAAELMGMPVSWLKLMAFAFGAAVAALAGTLVTALNGSVFPQSFEFSTLGGWIATRSGGHYATLYTHIDDFVEGLRLVTPSGVVETRRLPGSGAGPSPDRLFIGSEGILGVITEAWMRLQDRPTRRASASLAFPGEDGFLRGAGAVRAMRRTDSGSAPVRRDTTVGFAASPTTSPGGRGP